MFDSAVRCGDCFILKLDWLFDCAKAGRKLNEKPYLLHPLSEQQVNEITQRLHSKQSSTQQSQDPSLTNLNRALANAPQHSNVKNKGNANTNTPVNNNNQHTTSAQTLEDQQILCGVTVVAAVEDRQLEASCQNWVKQLGGEFVWDIKDSGVTHCLFEVNKKAKVDNKIADLYAKARGNPNIKIVSPMWLKACFESKCYVSESEYPPTLHPRMSLGMEKESTKQLPPPPPPTLGSQKLLIAPRSKRKIDFPEETPDVSTPLNKRPPSPPSSLLALTPIPHNSSYSSTPSSIPSRSPSFTPRRRPASPPPYRSTPYVRSSSPSPSSLSPPADDSSRSPILQAADPDATVSKSGYEAEVSSVSKSGNDDVSQVENSDKGEIDDGMADGLKVLTERIKLLQHETGPAPHLFLPPPPLSPPKKLKKSKSSKISRALLESERTGGKLDENSQEQVRDMSSQFNLHYSHSSFHASDEDASSACSQVVIYDDTSVTTKTTLLELAARNAETTNRETMRKELAGLFSSTDVKSPLKTSPKKSLQAKSKYEEPNPNLYVLPPPKKTRTFTLTGFSNEDKDKFATNILFIKALGGELTQEVVAHVTTHVIAEKPAQSEKYMSGCAAGCWVLHPSFLRACEDAAEWLDETKYEWTQENFEFHLDARNKSWIDTPRRCRLEVEGQQKEYSDISLHGMFAAMHCVLMQESQTSQLVRLLEAGKAKTTILTSLTQLNPEFLQGVTCAFSKRISDANSAFNNAITKMGLRHLILADLETVLHSGRSALHHPQLFPKDFELPQLLKPLPFLPQPSLKQPLQKITEDSSKKQKATTDNNNSPPRKPLAKVASPQKPRSTSPAPSSPKKPRPKSPQKRTTVSKAERNRSNSPPDAKTRKPENSSPPNKSRKLDSSPPRTRAKDTSPQKSKHKPGAGKLAKQESVYEYNEDSPPKKRSSTRKKK